MLGTGDGLQTGAVVAIVLVLVLGALLFWTILWRLITGGPAEEHPGPSNAERTARPADVAVAERPDQRTVRPPGPHELFYKTASDELEQCEARPALWTKALAETDCDANKAKAYYIRARAAEMEREVRKTQRPAEELASGPERGRVFSKRAFVNTWIIAGILGSIPVLARDDPLAGVAVDLAGRWLIGGPFFGVIVGFAVGLITRGRDSDN